MIINKKQYIYLILIFCIEFFSIYYARFYYDGFHLGLLINAAADIDAGKLIYKDFFYEYGLLNVYLNLLILKISNFNIFSLFVVYIQFYIAGIFLLYLTTKNLLNINYAILLVIIFFIIHPYILKPWHNYILFFLLSLYLYLKSLFVPKYDVIASFFLGIAFLFSETFLITSFFIFTADLIISYQYLNKKFLYKKIIYFIAPYFLFFIYLLNSNLYNDWLLHNNTYPVLLKYFYKSDIFSYIINNLQTFILSYKYLYSDMTIFFYSLIFLCNLIFIISNTKDFFKKNLDSKNLFFLFVSILNLLLISQILSNISTFKLITLSSFGFIIVFIYIKKIKDNYLRKLLVLIIILISINSLLDPKKEWNAKKYLFSNSNINFKGFNFLRSQKYPENIWEHLKSFDKLSYKIKHKCNIEYFANLTDDAYYYFLVREKFKFPQFLYWYQYQDKFYKNKYYQSLTDLFDKNFPIKVNEEMKKNNIFFITDVSNKNQIFLLNKKVSFKSNYTAKYLPYSSQHKQKIILIPKDCSI